mgnify:CR=1 FL=1
MSKLLDWAMMIVANEESARELSRIGIGVSTARHTNIIEFKNVVLAPEGSMTIIDITGSGSVDECLIISLSPDVALSIIADDVLIFDKNFNDALEVSQELIFLSAFVKEEDSQMFYVYHVKGIDFVKNVNITVSNTSDSEITIKHAICKYSQ